MIWAAILLAYFFLLRASEYTAADQSGIDTGKGGPWLGHPSQTEGRGGGQLRSGG